jgi:5-methylcytosine-specific restriction endonuclease McrA
MSLRWYARYEALKASRIERGLYQCAMCHESFHQSKVHVDHIEPVVPVNNPLAYMDIDWNQYIPRLFCEPEQLQILCTTCHECKTFAEDKMRVFYSEKKKEKLKLDKKKK